jgi:hypothetical protein
MKGGRGIGTLHRENEWDADATAARGPMLIPDWDKMSPSAEQVILLILCNCSSDKFVTQHRRRKEESPVEPCPTHQYSHVIIPVPYILVVIVDPLYCRHRPLLAFTCKVRCLEDITRPFANEIFSPKLFLPWRVLLSPTLYMYNVVLQFITERVRTYKINQLQFLGCIVVINIHPYNPTRERLNRHVLVIGQYRKSQIEKYS